MGISISGVKALIGEATNALSKLCTSSRINKWAKYKPISVKKTSRLNQNDRVAANYGLGLVDITEYIRYKLGYYEGKEYSQSDILAKIKEATYIRPSGGENSPYRLSDFEGYDEKTLAPDNWQDTSISEDALNRVIAEKYNDSIDQSALGWKLNHGIRAFSNCGILLTEGGGSNNIIGSGVSANGIPVGSLGKLSFSDQTTRLGVIVWAEHRQVGNIVFVAPWPLNGVGSFNDRSFMLPDMSTNVDGAKKLEVGYSYKCTPFIITNTTLTLTYKGTAQNQYYVTTGPLITSASKIYAMPSGTKSFNLKVKGGDGTEVSAPPSIVVDHTKDSVLNSTVAVGRYGNGMAGGGHSWIPVYSLCIFSINEKSSVRLNGHITYHPMIGSGTKDNPSWAEGDPITRYFNNETITLGKKTFSDKEGDYAWIYTINTFAGLTIDDINLKIVY